MYGKFRKERLAAALLALSLTIGPAAVALAADNGETQSAAAQTEEAAGGASAAADGATADTAMNETAAEAKITHIVAVGDSLTLGYEYGLTAKADAYGYVDRVYEQALYRGRADLQNFGVLGLKSAGLRHWLEAAADGEAITAEEAQPGLAKYPFASDTIALSGKLGAALRQADLIVMTIGGNDFLPLFDDIQAGPVTADELKKLVGDTLASYKTSLEASLDTLVALNPHAEIVFADQYLPVPKPSRLIKAVTDEQYEALLDGTKQLRALVETVGGEYAAKGYGVKTVDVSEAFLGNELIYTSILKGDTHPKQDGYEQFGKAFATAIWGEYREPAELNGAPLRIVVNGRNVDGKNKPALIAGTTYLPMRVVADALHAALSWDNKTKTATLSAGGRTVAFKIGAKAMTVDGASVPLQTAAYLDGKASATYLPLAALSRGLGYQVIYRKQIKSVFIDS